MRTILKQTIRQLATDVGQSQATDEVVATQLEAERFMARLWHDNPEVAEKIAQDGGLSFTPSAMTRRLLFGPSQPLLARRNSTGSTVKNFYFRARDPDEAAEMIEEMSANMRGIDLASSVNSNASSRSLTFPLKNDAMDSAGKKR